VILGDDNVEALVPKSDEFALQVTEMLLGPFNFYANKNQSIFGSQGHIPNDTSFGS